MDKKQLKETIMEVVSDMFHVGEVVNTDPESCTARVKLPDRDDFITSDLMVLQPKTHKDKYYFMPDIGEMVLCLFLGNGSSVGFILGSAYNKHDLTAYLGRQGSNYLKFEDETEINYDKENSLMFLNVEGKTEAYIRDEVLFDCPDIVTISKDIRTDAENIEINTKNIKVNADKTDVNSGATDITGNSLNVNCSAVNLGNSANARVVHEFTICPVFGIPIGSVNPSNTTKTAQ